MTVLMKLLFLLIFWLSSIEASPYFDGKLLHVPIDDEYMFDLYQHWTDQAFSGLFAAIASQKVKTSPQHVKDQVEKCSKNAKTLVLHAKCVSSLLKNEFDHMIYRKAHKYRPKVKVKKPKTAFVQEFHEYFHSNLSIPIIRPTNIRRKHHMTHVLYKKMPMGISNFDMRSSKRFKKYFSFKRQAQKSKILDYNGKDFSPSHVYKSRLLKYQHHPMVKIHKLPEGYGYRRRMRRHVVQGSNYEIKSTLDQASPFAFAAKLLQKIVMLTKNKTEIPPWQVAVEKIREHRIFEKRMQHQQNESPIMDYTRYMFHGMHRDDVIDPEELATDRRKLDQYLQHRDQDKLSGPTQRIANFFRETMKLGYSLAGQDASKLDNKTIHAFSPKFMSVVPEQDEEDKVNLLSPNLFSFHEQKKKLDNLTSIPNLLQNMGKNDRQQWLDLIMEASGVNEEVEKIGKLFGRQEKKLPFTNYRQKDDVIDPNVSPYPITKENITQMYGKGSFEERKIITWEMLDKSYSKEQRHEINTTGYAILTKDQLYLVYGPHSPFNDSHALERLSKLNKSEIQSRMIEDIHKIAKMKDFKIRNKRATILAPIFFRYILFSFAVPPSDIILSPVVFSPVIMSHTLFGAVTLSPIIFSPHILNTRIGVPIILSPLLFIPIILQPSIFYPFILVPGGFNPIVMSPRIMSPLIMAPQVFTPIILTPLILGPQILNPAVGTPLVFSPFVLSPVILSPKALFAIVFSPYAASPNIESKIALGIIYFSPSILS